MNCESCKERQKQVEAVPYIVHESGMARMERIIRRLWIVVIILILLFVGTNAAWIWYESQWETFDMEVTQENENGFNSFIGMDGDINIGDKALQADDSCEGPEA